MKGLRILLCFLLLSAGPLHVRAENTFRISDELNASIQQGLHELYELNFDQAEKIFQSLRGQAAEHPMVAFGMASVHWWRLSVFVLETDENESRPFLESVDVCIKLSKEKIDRGDPTGEAHLTLGGVYGLLGRWQATNQKWTSAYFTGKKAIKYLRKAMKVNPEMKDAYMGLGMFDYYVATLPSVVRVLAFLGSEGDPQVGLDELQVAANESLYARVPSKLFLAEIYSNLENQPEKALEILSGVRQELPHSYFIHMMQIIAYYNHNHLDELVTEANNLTSLLNDGTYTSGAAVMVHFANAMAPFKMRRWNDAIHEFDLAINSGTVKDPWFTWAHLYRGYCLDALGKHDEAVKMYRIILSQLRRWGSHDAAKKHIDKPFTGTDAELKKLSL